MEVVLINLDKDTERLDIVSKHLNEKGIEFKRISGVEHDNKHKGFSMATVNALKEIPNGGIIFEDDVLLNDFYIPELPEDWDILYFGANLQAPTERVSKDIVRVLGAWTTHAVMYSSKAVRNILALYDYDIHGVYDEFLRRDFNPINNCYMLTPMIAYQRPSYSHILNSYVDYREAMDLNYNKYISK